MRIAPLPSFLYNVIFLPVNWGRGREGSKGFVRREGRSKGYRVAIFYDFFFFFLAFKEELFVARKNRCCNFGCNAGRCRMLRLDCGGTYGGIVYSIC